MHGWIKVISVNLLIFAVLILLVELAVRLFFSANLPFDKRNLMNLEYQPSGLSLKWPKPDQKIYETDNGEVFTDKLKFHINADGIRYDEIPRQKKEGEIRIVIIGGSHVFDLNSYDYNGDYGFPKLLEDLLAKEFKNIRVINGGIPAANSLGFANKILYEFSRYEPDYIIFNSIWNDVKWIYNLEEDTQLIRTAPLAIRKNPFIEKVSVWDGILGWSLVYRKVRDAYHRYKLRGYLKKNEDQLNMKRLQVANQSSENEKDIKLGLQQYQKNVEAFVALSKVIGAKPIIAIEERFPDYEMTDDQKLKIKYSLVGDISHFQLVNTFEKCDAILRKVANENDIPLIDIHAEMAGNDDFFYDHVHTTPEGSRYIAQRYAKIMSALFLKKTQETAVFSTVVEDQRSAP